MQNYRILLKFPKRDPRILIQQYIENGISTFYVLTVFQNKNLIFCSNQLISSTKKEKRIPPKKLQDSLEISLKIPTEIPAISGSSRTNNVENRNTSL